MENKETISITENSQNNEIKIHLKSNLNELMGQFLFLLEIALPFSKGDNSDNEKRFNLIRSKLLRVGNDSIRELDSIYENYATIKLNDYIKVQRQVTVTDIISFKEKFHMNKIGGKV